jgi:acyl-CoA thioesterase-2
VSDGYSDHDIDFVTLMTLESHGPDVFVGICEPVVWQRVYGGQVVAQALRAAALTVDDSHRVHSIHGYFIRAGTVSEPIRFEVDRTRNGRSFSTRRVVARQSGGAICTLEASFQRAEDEAEVALHRPPDGIPPLDDLSSMNWGPLLDRRSFHIGDDGTNAGAWLRVRADLGDDPILQACALAYASDDMPTEAAIAAHPLSTQTEPENYERFMAATLDHTIWFHRPLRAEEWHVHTLQGQGLTGGRGLALGRVYDGEGLHVATVAQEVVVREMRRPERDQP